eukprot:gb/GEZJ01001019.1/.p1 GENE.gb/GEZJ01001019.1/~~gb/GEZJ01001019.1/.p1  ORF type:complete len:412 (+),score=67.82 gb/GEZJ01001019.1/:338-1573(+)
MPLATDRRADARAPASRRLPLRARVRDAVEHPRPAVKRCRAAPPRPSAPSPPQKRARHAGASIDSLVLANVLLAKSRVPRGFVRSARPNVIDARLREVVVDWLMEVAAQYAAPSTTLALAVNYLDRMLACCSVTRASVQPVAVVCMLLACKMDHSEPPSMLDGVAMCDLSTSTSTLRAMETTILLRLNFDLNVFTPSSVLTLLLRHIVPRHIQPGATQLSSVLSHVAMLHAQLAWRAPATIALACVLLCLHVLGVHLRSVLNVAHTDLRRALCTPAVVDSAVLLWHKWLALHHPCAKSRWLLRHWPDVFPHAYPRGAPLSPHQLRLALQTDLQLDETTPASPSPSPLRESLPTTPTTAEPARRVECPPTPSSHTTASQRGDSDAPVSNVALLSSSPPLHHHHDELARDAQP